MSNSRLRGVARAIYHRLPVSQRTKWRLRERLGPLIAALTEAPTFGTVSRGLANAVVGVAGGGAARDPACETALAEIMMLLGRHVELYGPASHWLALPFLASGGAERVALNICRALRELRPGHSCVLLLTDRRLVNEAMRLPEGALLVVFDDHLEAGTSYARKQALLRDLLIAVRPECFHNINSEVAWHLILEEGERLKRFVRLFASIFAFQFAPDGRTKIGYAAYFLKKGLPHLSGLLSDNRRFIDDAALEYALNDEEKGKLGVLYQPCRLEGSEVGMRRPTGGRLGTSTRLQVLWAGRLDEEKRVELFIEVVRRCEFADFRVFGQVVLSDGAELPLLPNLSYEGAFASPQEWLKRHTFDAFLFTSKWEGLPNILLEVAWLGIPIVAPEVGGVGELVSVETGYPLPERPTVDDYERALRLIGEQPEQAAERAARLQTLVSERHGWSAFREALAAVPGYVPQSAREGGTVAPASNAGVEVSVILPCFNQGHYLFESVSSVCAATRGSLEVLVVDDGSTDPRTERYLCDIEATFPAVVRVIRQSNQGLSGARNTGLKAARGQFIQFLDADDVLAPGKIDAQLAQMAVNPAIDVSVCNFLLCDESRSNFSKPEEAIARFDLTLDDFLYRWERGFAIPIHCGLFQRRVLPKDGFDVRARAKEDWLFWTGLAMTGAHFAYIHGHWAIYRQHPNSMRRSYVGMGRSWLQAGLTIDSMLAGREPLFFESVVTWFEQCYRNNPAYRNEIAELRSQGPDTQPGPSGVALASLTDVGPSPAPQLIDTLRVALGKQEGVPPLLSVVVPVYGHFDHLAGCLRSLAVQGDVSFEIVCVDDGSPDPRVTALMETLKGRLSRLNIIMLAHNQGISSAQNIAVEAARGEFIAFLDCDDELAPGALSVIEGQIAQHPEVDYFFSDRQDVDESGRPVRIARYGGYDTIRFSAQSNIRDDLLDGMVASHLKVIRRTAYLEAGGCDPKFSGVQDWDLALRIAEQGSFYYVDQTLYRHRVHLKSVTRRDLVAQFRKTNLLRRAFARRWLMSARDAASAQNVLLIRASDLPLPLSVLKQHWREGKLCELDLRGTFSHAAVSFVREFNSYFERILWNDPAVPAALVGYVWDTCVFDRYMGASKKPTSLTPDKITTLKPDSLD